MKNSITATATAFAVGLLFVVGVALGCATEITSKGFRTTLGEAKIGDDCKVVNGKVECETVVGSAGVSEGMGEAVKVIATGATNFVTRAPAEAPPINITVTMPEPEPEPRESE